MQRSFILWGLGIGLLAAALSWSVLLGFAFFVLFLCAGTLWKRGEPPMLSFCIAYQWLFVVAGYIYYLVTGVLIGGRQGDVEGAVFLSMMGFLFITMGVRLGFKCVKIKPTAPAFKREEGSLYDIRYLFWMVIALYTLNWFMEVNPYAFWGLAQVFAQVLLFRTAFVVLLFLEIAVQRKGYLYGIVGGGFFVLPTATSMYAAWSILFFMLLLVFLYEWRPWIRTPLMKAKNRKVVSMAIGVTVVLFTLGLIWQGGGVKRGWRRSLMAGAEKANPVEKMRVLGGVTKDRVSHFNLETAFESLIERLSGVYPFTQVLEYVPKVIPYEQGRLTWRAIEHVLKPRFLFPDKPSLGSNSWLVRKYTGYWVAGEESGTSIGLTYMAEFYIDYGRVGMFIPLLLWGMLIGFTYRCFFMISPSHRFASATVISAYLQPFASYEGEIAYLIGGLLLTLAIYGAILFFLGSWLHRVLKPNPVYLNVEKAFDKGY